MHPSMEKAREEKAKYKINRWVKKWCLWKRKMAVITSKMHKVEIAEMPALKAVRATYLGSL